MPGYSPNTGVTQFDNPRFSGSVYLEPWESIEADATYVTHGRHKIRLSQTCSGSDPFCSPFAIHTVRPVVTDLQWGPNAYDFVAYGARLGLGASTLAFAKEDNLYVPSEYSASSARLDEETILVPIHVVVVMPEDTDAMDGLDNPLLYHALFDDDYSDPSQTLTVSHPGEGIYRNFTESFQSPSQTVDFEEAFSVGYVLLNSHTEVRPDEIWVQCGIQFRLASVTVLTTPTTRSDTGYEALSNNTYIGSLSQRARGVTETGDHVYPIEGDVQGPGFFVAIVPYVGSDSSLQANIGRAFGNVAAFSALAGRANLTRGVIAHELGHVFGLNHSPDCTTAEKQHLMCDTGTHNLNIGGCGDWREGVERKRDGVLCIEPPCGEPEIDLPINCESGFRTQAASVCSAARAGAGALSATVTGNKPPIVALTTADGMPTSALPDSSSVFSGPTPAKVVECADSFLLRTTTSSEPGDPYPAIATRMGGWQISYAGSSGTMFERFPASQELEVDLNAHPATTVSITRTVFDVQGMSGSANVYIGEWGDSEPPTIGAIPSTRLPGCADGTARTIAPPTAQAEDNCGEIEFEARLVALNGVAISPPVLVEGGEYDFSDAGDYTIEWIAIDGSGNESDPVEQTVTVDACVMAGSSLAVQNSAKLRSSTGAPMSLMVLGSSSSRIGGLAEVGSVTSAGALTVEGGALVTGNITSASTVQVQAGATVTGTVAQNQTLSLPTMRTIQGTFPSTCSGSAQVFNADSGTHNLAPGCYSELRLGSRSTLVLQAGTYSWGSVTVEPDAKIVTVAGAKFDVLHEVTFRGRVKNAVGNDGFLIADIRGNGSSFFEAPFSGAILAPAGTLVLGGTSGQVFRGSFSALNVEVRSGLEIVGQNDGGYSTQAFAFADAEWLDFDDVTPSCSTSGPARPASWYGVGAALAMLGVVVRRRTRQKAIG